MTTSENEPLLESTTAIWSPPRGFFWIQLGMYIDLAQEMETNVLQLSCPMYFCPDSMGQSLHLHMQSSAPNSTLQTPRRG